MTAVIHGLVSGLIWSAILGTCMFAIAAVITPTAPPSAVAHPHGNERPRPSATSSRSPKRITGETLYIVGGYR
jgi:hypothetical protein